MKLTIAFIMLALIGGGLYLHYAHITDVLLLVMSWFFLGTTLITIGQYLKES